MVRLYTKGSRHVRSIVLGDFRNRETTPRFVCIMHVMTYKYFMLCMINMYVRILVALADKVLTHSRKLVHSHTTKRLGHRWPATHRTLRRRLHNHCGWFWDHVTLTESLDISTFGLSVKKIKFTFVDPIFVWLQHYLSWANSYYGNRKS